MDVASTLAYYDTVTITTVKSFTVQALSEKTSLGADDSSSVSRAMVTWSWVLGFEPGEYNKKKLKAKISNLNNNKWLALLITFARMKLLLASLYDEINLS